MGTSRFRSWSFSREKTFRECPRRFFFEYFPYGEPDANVLGVMKKATCLSMLVGTITHDLIANALRLFKATGKVRPGMHRQGVALFDDALTASAKAAPRVNQGLAVPIGTQVLLHHLEKGSFEMRETLARESLVTYLDAFEASVAWDWLRSTERRDWQQVKAATDRKESIIASSKLGFQSSIGLRIYTPYDLALKVSDDFLIIDWKTGEKSSRAMASAKRQTAIYALRALDKDFPLENIKLAPYWLKADRQVETRTVEADEIADVIRGIEEHDMTERALLTERKDGEGKVEFCASKEDFQPKVGRHCADCKYRKLCPEGSRSVKPSEISAAK